MQSSWPADGTLCVLPCRCPPCVTHPGSLCPFLPLLSRPPTAVVVLARHFDVAVVAVVVAPAVLNEPVVTAGGVRAIANRQDGVVKVIRLVATSLVVVHAL